MEFFVKYKGVDWLAMIFTLLSLYYLVKHRKRAFIFSGVSSLCWMVFGVLTQSWAAILSNLVYVGFNIYGWRQWNRDQAICPDQH